MTARRRRETYVPAVLESYFASAAVAAVDRGLAGGQDGGIDVRLESCRCRCADGAGDERSCEQEEGRCLEFHFELVMG